jgi:Transposase DDE domain.
MNTGKTVFAQLLEHFPYYEFSKCVDRYQGEYKVKSFSCLSQFLAMAFAQLTQRESLRDIETCLRAMRSKLYHIGFRGNVARNTLANANSQRDWHIYADFALSLINTARRLYANEDFGVQLKKMVYALDSTTIDLCLSLFPWAKFRQHKAAVKMHTLLDLHGNIPSFIWITSAAVHDVNILDLLPVEAGAYYLLDRGYLDYSRLYNIHTSQAFFITRTKSNFQFRRVYSHPVKKSLGIICDQTVVLTGFYATRDYPDKLRRIHYYDTASQRHLTFLTNNFSLAATTIARLFKCRWQIELFFKWIKQHLHIKAFYGTSTNAVKTQIWIAIAIYVMVAILRKRLNIDAPLYNVLQILSVTLFEKSPLLQVLSEGNVDIDKEQHDNQLNLFD